MFLGEYLDCTIELGKNILQTHQRYTLASAPRRSGLGRVAGGRMHGAARRTVSETGEAVRSPKRFSRLVDSLIAVELNPLDIVALSSL